MNQNWVTILDGAIAGEKIAAVMTLNLLLKHIS